jgi:acyl-coenzyme A synthetase/AMP-(fatty) acid ligase
MADDNAGEVPKAFVVKSRNVGNEEADLTIIEDIMKYVQKHKTRYKWLKAVEFIPVIPKSASGKILRRVLREMDRSQKQQAKL